MEAISWGILWRGERIAATRSTCCSASGTGLSRPRYRYGPLANRTSGPLRFEQACWNGPAATTQGDS